MIEENKIGFSVDEIRKDFPTLSREVYGKPLVYFDNGATSQKPQRVIDRISRYYEDENANIHRGVHYLSQFSTTNYENARTTIQEYLNAEFNEEIIFTTGTTGSINLVASSFGQLVKPGDEIIISAMEHHSNIVPWQLMCERTGAVLKVIPMSKEGELDLEVYRELLSQNTKLVSVTHISNTLGTINPIKNMIDLAHNVGALFLVDGAQSIQHMTIDVRDLDCDFFAFSGHKVFGPTGVGVLYGKRDVLNSMPPYQGGGDMIEKVTFEKTTYNDLPHKFEAGTPNISGGLGLAEAIKYLSELDLVEIQKYEKGLARYAEEKLTKIDGLRIIGNAKEKTSVVSFIVEGIHPFDVGTLLDKMGIAVRTGHHCTQPIMDFYGIPGTIRASFAFYNTKEEIDSFIQALDRSLQMLK